MVGGSRLQPANRAKARAAERASEYGRPWLLVGLAGIGLATLNTIAGRWNPARPS